MKRTLTLLAVATFALTACGGSHTAATVPSKAVSTQKHVRHLKSDKKPLDALGGPGIRLVLDLLDAPLIGADASNAKFNVGIIGVDAIDANGDSWQLIANQSPQVVDLLTLQTSALNMGNGQLPAGSYPAVQLLLDPSTTNVVSGGQTYPVAFTDPSHPWWDSTQTIEAISVPLNITGSDGDSITATLDFNVFQSANLQNGIAYVTPTIAGGIGSPSINGSVVNAAGSPVSNATIIATDASGNVANTTVTGADGTFHLHGINAGSYTLSVANTFTTNAGVTVTANGADPGAAPSTLVVVGPNGVSIPPIND
ncbi:MAG: carboxypeptidase regulatory-like domain-containing protein [Actinobacteria bacterium]|nr:carboxypeptidase regulatory-like domain-containing protein [Actinomycetota bacterium]